MAVGVERHQVPSLHGLRGKMRSAVHLLADHEERRPRPRALEQLEYRGRPLGVRPVVERERHPGLGYRPPNVECCGSARNDRSEQMPEHERMMPDGVPELEAWLPDPAIRVAHSRGSSADPETLWRAARTVRVRDAALLGRLVQWRIPGTPAALAFDELFRRAPFSVLEQSERALVSGIVGRIWTLRRDYPALADGEEFRRYDAPGSARVLFAMWAVPDGRGARLHSEVRASATGSQGRLGLAAVRPLISAFHNLIGSDGLAVAVRRAEEKRLSDG